MSANSILGNIAQEATQQQSIGLLGRILMMLMSPRGYDKTLARYRQTAILESGTVTTVSTVSNIGQIGSRDAAQQFINPVGRTSWALNHRSRIS